MAQSIGDVIINVEANTQRLVDGFNRAEKTVTQSTKQMKNAVETFAAAYISLDGIVSGAKFFLKQADAMTTVESRLKLVTKGTEDLLKTQKELFESSQNNRVVFTQTADLYQRIARSTNAYNIEQSRVLTLTDSISKAMVIGGGTAESQKNALIQLGQAFSANFKSVGQELASLREQAPRVYEAILAGMNDGAGVTADVFRKMAEDGKLSVEIIIKALEKAAPELAREYEAIAKTFEQGTIQLSNALKQTIKEIDNTFEISSTASDFMTDLSTSLKESTPAIIEFMKAAKENKDVVISLGEAYLAYKASVIAISAVNSAYVPIKQLVTKAKEAETAATLAQVQAEKMSALATEAKTALEAQSALVTDLKTKSETLSAQASMKSAELEKARIDLKYGLNGATATYVKTLEAEIVALTKEADASLKQSIANEKAIASLNKKAVATEAASLRATEYATKMELASANSGIFATAIGGLGNLLKTFAPIAALTIITEIFMNWDKITGKVKNNLASSAEELAKMSKNQLADQLNQFRQQVKGFDSELLQLNNKLNSIYFAPKTEQEETAIKARIDALTQEKEKVQDLIKETNKLTEAKITKKASFYESVADVSNQVASQARNIEASSKEIAKVLDPFGEKIKDIRERYKKLIDDIESNKNAAFGSLKQAELLPDDTKRKKELIDEAKKNADKADKEIIEATKARNKEIADANEEHNKDANKEAEKWAKKKLELLSEISIAEQDELAKPYIKLEQEYQKDLMEFGKTQEAKDLITKDYYAKVEALNKKTVEDFNKKEEEKFKKSVEWQIKIFEASEKLNDQLIAQREKMYGEDSARHIEAWYQNQLEMLGKLAIEGKATEKEISALLAQIEQIRQLKIQETTLSFKVEKTFYNSFEKNLSDSIESGFKDANLKSILRSIGKDIWSSVASYSASNITSALRGGASLLGGLSSLAVGSSVSASEIANIMNSGGTFDSSSNTITTSGGSKINVGSDGGGTVKSTGSDVMSLVNTISTLKTAYGILSNGLSSYVLSGFQGVSSGLGYLGMTGAASTLGEFGVGFASPWATQAAYSTAQAAGGTAGLYGSGVGEIGGSQMAGSYMGGAAIGGALGYGAGWLGDKAFGAKTQASNLGAVGGMVGSYFGPIGTAVGASVGAIIGGAIGSKKFKDSGVQFLTDVMSDTVLNTDTAISFQDWEKKSWFSKTTGTSTSPLSEDSIKSIKKMFNTYDTLLSYLGDADKIVMKAGKYTPENLQFHMIKNFLTAFTDVNQDTDETIYNTWYEYAKSINKTITEALQESVNTFVSEKRTFEIWQVGADSIEGLAKKAEFANADLEMLKNSMGVTSLTVESFLTDFENAVKTNFTPETITQWELLGNALMTATDASKAYNNALTAEADAKKAEADAEAAKIVQNALAIANYASGFELFTESLKGETFALTYQIDNHKASIADLEKVLDVSDITVDNFKDKMLEALEGVTDETVINYWFTLGNELQALTDIQNQYAQTVQNTSDTMADSMAALAEQERVLAEQSAAMQEIASAKQEYYSGFYELYHKASGATDLYQGAQMPSFSNNAELVNWMTSQMGNLDLEYANAVVDYNLQLFKEMASANEQSATKQTKLLESINSTLKDIDAFQEELFLGSMTPLTEFMKASALFATLSVSASRAREAYGANDIDLFSSEVGNIKTYATDYLGIAKSQSTNRIDYARDVASVNALLEMFPDANKDPVVTAIENLTTVAQTIANNTSKETIATSIPQNITDQLKSTISREEEKALLNNGGWAGYFDRKSSIQGAMPGTGDRNTDWTNGVDPVAFNKAIDLLVSNESLWSSPNSLNLSRDSIWVDTAKKIGGDLDAAAAAIELANRAFGEVTYVRSDPSDPKGLNYIYANKGYEELYNKMRSGEIESDLYQESILQLNYDWVKAQKRTIDGSHATGLDYVPYDGYLAELHKGEKVQTASEVRKDNVINELKREIKDLKDIFIKNTADMMRMSKVISRVDDGDALKMRVVS